MIFKTFTIHKANRLPLALVAMAALASCNKDASAPTGFGVNITVDAKALSAADRARVTSGDLLVVVGTTPAPKKNLSDHVHDAIQSGELRFHYTPEASVRAGDTLTFGFDALDASKKIISSGSSAPVILKASAVAVTIKLAAVTPGDGGSGDGNGKGNGTACVAGTECGSGFCADGVCCNEKCDDVCVSCNQDTTKGMCTPFAVDTDPEKECSPKLPPMLEPDDGGAPATDGPAMADAAKPASGDASTSSDAAAAEVAPSDAAVINPPDGGFMSMPTACAGACGGARACKYPGKEKPCGKAFCNTPQEPGGFVCDGAGSCNIALSKCNDFACDEATGACGTRCTAHTDCVPGDYCDGPTHTCGPKNGNGLKCTTDDECKSGHCATGVCCNSACDSPLSCNTTGKVGQCSCPGLNCTGACQLFYPDGDGDGFGDRTSTYAAGTGTAKPGCAGAPPAGYVADNTDCDDKDPNAHPGQLMFFGVVSKSGRWDYDCDEKQTKETPEYVGGSCRFCGAVGTCDQTTTTCGTANQTASFACPQEYGGIIRAAPATTLTGTLEPLWTEAELLPSTGRLAADPSLAPAAVLPPPIICQICISQCCGCQAKDKTGFRQVVACGDASIPAYTCGSCSVAGGAASPMTTSYKQQRCR